METMQYDFLKFNIKLLHLCCFRRIKYSINPIAFFVIKNVNATTGWDNIIHQIEMDKKQTNPTNTPDWDGEETN